MQPGHLCLQASLRSFPIKVVYPFQLKLIHEVHPVLQLLGTEFQQANNPDYGAAPINEHPLEQVGAHRAHFTTHIAA